MSYLREQLEKKLRPGYLDRDYPDIPKGLREWDCNFLLVRSNMRLATGRILLPYEAERRRKRAFGYRFL